MNNNYHLVVGYLPRRKAERLIKDGKAERINKSSIRPILKCHKCEDTISLESWKTTQLCGFCVK